MQRGARQERAPAFWRCSVGLCGEASTDSTDSDCGEWASNRISDGELEEAAAATWVAAGAELAEASAGPSSSDDGSSSC